MSSELKAARDRIIELERVNAQLVQDKAVMQHVIDCCMALQRGEMPPPDPEWMRRASPPDTNSHGGEA